MKVVTTTGSVMQFKVGEKVPFGIKLKKIYWDLSDILPDAEKFRLWMATEINTKFENPQSVRFSAEATD